MGCATTQLAFCDEDAVCSAIATGLATIEQTQSSKQRFRFAYAHAGAGQLTHRWRRPQGPASWTPHAPARLSSPAHTSTLKQDHESTEPCFLLLLGSCSPDGEDGHGCWLELKKCNGRLWACNEDVISTMLIRCIDAPKVLTADGSAALYACATSALGPHAPVVGGDLVRQISKVAPIGHSHDASGSRTRASSSAYFNDFYTPLGSLLPIMCALVASGTAFPRAHQIHRVANQLAEPI